MDERTFAAIALSNRDFSSLEAKLVEAIKWIELAAGSGAHFAVLPELLNQYCGDGPGNPRALSNEQIALDDWEKSCHLLIETAKRLKISIVIPVLRREYSGNQWHLINCFFLISREGEILGEYQKRCPPPEELSQHVRPGYSSLISWEGLKVGGAICFDTLFPEVFAEQAEAGADLFIVPSLWPGGSQLNTYALEYSTPIILSYPAWSRIIDIDGSDVAGAGYRSETLRFGFGSPIALATINFDRVSLYGNHNQECMVEVQRAYGSRVRIRFIQQDMLFILESRCVDLKVADVIKQFGLIPRRDYFRQCRMQIAGQSQGTNAPPAAGRP